MKMTMMIRYFSSSSRKRAPNLRKINPRVPFVEAASIAEGLYGVIKSHGPLTIGNAWDHAKVCQVYLLFDLVYYWQGFASICLFVVNELGFVL